MFRKKTVIEGRGFRNRLYTQTINSQTITVRDYDHNGKILLAYGTAAASTQDSQSVYAKGAEYIKTDVTTGTAAKYQNVGTAASSSFELMTVASTGDITEVIAGTGATGGGATGSVTVDVAAGHGTTVRANNVDVGVDVYNDTGVQLERGTLVNLSGFDTTLGVTMTLADADAGVQATHVVDEVIPDVTAGVVYPIATVVGDVTDVLDTSARTIGDLVYLSATAGGWTASAVTGSDQLSQVVGIVKVVSATVGEIVFFPGAQRILKLPTSHIQDRAVTEAKVVDSAGVGTLAVKKTAIVVYDFAVDGGAQGAIALTGSPTIPDNAVCHVESYDVLTTATSNGADAGTITLGFPTDGDLFAAIAISDGTNPWDAGVFASNTGALASHTPKKTAAARTFQLTVAGGNDLTAGKIVFQVSYWVSQ